VYQFIFVLFCTVKDELKTLKEDIGSAPLYIYL